MSGANSPVRVAILGGGLAGATLFRGLMKHPQLQVDIFESAPEFREQGQAIGTNQNGIWALELLGLKDCMVNAGATHLEGIRAVIGHGPDTGLILGDIELGERGTWVAHRASFLEQVLKGIETSHMHTGKKLLKIEQGEEITLYFEDGTTHVCDIALGADGIHSRTRKFVVGNDQDAESVFAGWRGTWQLVPFDKAVDKLGPDLLDVEKPYQYCWIGPGGFTLHDLTSNNTLVQCIIAKRVPEDTVDGTKEFWTMVPEEELSAIVEGWDPRMAKGMVELSVKPSELTPMVSLRQHKPIPSFVRGGVAVIGDAAGATTPWQGSGGSMAMEDAYLLSQLFAHVKTAEDARAALRAYDHVNRPRRHRLIASSYETGLLMSGSHPEVGMDTAKLRERIMHRWEWIVNVDLLKNRDEAIRMMQNSAS